jgi:hypothetical protein
MESDEAFRRFGRAIESDPLGVLLATWRRDAFTARLRRLPDVAEVIPSGSLAGGTHVGDIHDVDLIVVFDSSDHPDWGHGEVSVQAALERLQTGLVEQMHPLRGAEDGLLDETELRNHVVKCHGVSLGPFQGMVPAAPPTDVMPAIRAGSHLRVPERMTNRWIDVDPEKLIRLVAERQREWKYYKEVVHMVKIWAERNNLNMRSVAIEVLVLKYCPRPRVFQTLSCGEAVARFFEAAAKAHITSLNDPAGRCGEIDPGMNYGTLRDALENGAKLAREAMDAELARESPHPAGETVPRPDDCWRKLFGGQYPRARQRYWHVQRYEPWFSRDRPEAGPVRWIDDPWPGGGPEPGGGAGPWEDVFGPDDAPTAVPLTFG